MATPYDADPCQYPDIYWRDELLWRRKLITTLCQIQSGIGGSIVLDPLLTIAGDIKNIVSTETTLQQVLTALQTLTVGVTVTSLTVPAGLATEATLAALNAKVTVCDTANIAGTVTANLGTIAGVATEVTLAALNAKVTVCDTANIAGTVTANLGTIAGVATEVTLAALNAKVTVCDTANIAGTVTANLGTIAGVATEATLAALNAKVTVCDTANIAGTVTSDAGSGWVDAPSVGAATAGLTGVMSMVNAVGAAAQLVQPTTPSDIQPVSAASLPLPAGAATEATLVSIDAKITACDTGAVTISALPNEGQQTMANSISVAIASDQSAVPISAASLPLPSGAATSANQTTIIGYVDGLEALLTSTLLELQVLNQAVAMQVDDAGGGVTYQGWAAAGAATAAASWRIRKITATGDDYSILWADSNINFDNVWDNRAALSYG